jgi:hypothetical protein
MLGRSDVHAEGALEIGRIDGSPEKGFSAGWSTKHATKKEAEEMAMKRCKEEKNAPDEVKLKCRIEKEFTKQCVAIAIDPERGTPGVGWSIMNNDKEKEARADALKTCVNTAGDRKDKCTMVLSSCD